MASLDDLEQRLARLEDRDREDLIKRLSGIEQQVSKIRGDSLWRFLVQVILAPLMIVAVGLIVNWQIERNKSENDRIAAAREMIPLLFDENPDKAFATEALLARIVDPDIADELHAIVAQHYSSVIKTSLQRGDTATAARVLAAAEKSGGEAAAVVVDSTRRDAQSFSKLRVFTSRSAGAEAKEREGFEMLIAGKYDAAIKAFEAAEAAYPSYHSVYEIARLLRSRRSDLNDVEKRGEILAKIAGTYMVPEDLRASLTGQTVERPRIIGQPSLRVVPGR